MFGSSFLYDRMYTDGKEYFLRFILCMEETRTESGILYCDQIASFSNDYFCYNNQTETVVRLKK